MASQDQRRTAQSTGAPVSPVQHVSKDASKGERGRSGKRTAADATSGAQKHDDGIRDMHIRVKQTEVSKINLTSIETNGLAPFDIYLSDILLSSLKGYSGGRLRVGAIYMQEFASGNYSNTARWARQGTARREPQSGGKGQGHTERGG